ncbi:uncharacterized protein LOC141691786 [Apium graveolens]|uniref:uncharacterized protein LOC141691786 n=1 Tax=Apium graveolens TaxID=4045 RepID=UPI003D79974F
MDIHIIFKFSKRWKILLDNVSGLTVKSLCNTRWESRIKSVKAIRFQAPQIRLALLKLKESPNEPKSVSEAESLIGLIESFEFLLGMVIWYDILFFVNMVSKKLQSKSMCIGATMKQLESVLVFFEKYREKGFISSMNVAKEIAIDMDVEPTFPIKRCVYRKKQFDENDDGEEVRTLEESFRIDFFMRLIDIAISSLRNRNLATTFSHNGLSDFELDVLVHEVEMLLVYVPGDLTSAINIIEFVRSLDCLPNVAIAYRILLSIPVSVASAERSFSKLKLLKNYLRSSMSQERLNGLVVLCIERDMLENIDVDTIITDFASRSARRSYFS